MNRMKYLTSILGVAVLMVVVAACGSGSSVNTVTPPASAVQPDDQLQASGSTPELDISQVIQMAQSGQLDEIEVSGDSLKVTTTDGQVFTSRKEAGASLLELLNEQGVETGVGGVQIDVKKQGGNIWPNLNRDEIVDVVANLDWSAPVTPSTPAGIAVGEPYPIPTADKSCGPMAIVAITSGGQVSSGIANDCFDPYGSGMANYEPDGQVVDPQTPVTPPAPDLTHGSPPVLSGAPVPSLKFDGVDYVHSGYAELPSGEGAVFVIDGIEVNVTNLELVGTTTEGRTAGIDQGLEIYRSHIAGDTDTVYTFTPGEVTVNPEDGQIFESPASWTRWTATDKIKEERCTCISPLRSA